jgi:hypothetical protein
MTASFRMSKLGVGLLKGEVGMAKTKETSSSMEKKAARTKTVKPTHNEIAERAFQIYLERNGAPGDPMQDWIRAEQELSAKPKPTRKKSKVVSIAA